MRPQEHLVSVQFGRAGDSGYGLTWPFLIDGEQVAVPRPLVVILKSLAIGLGLA